MDCATEAEVDVADERSDVEVEVSFCDATCWVGLVRSVVCCELACNLPPR